VLSSEGRLLVIHGLADENVHFKHTELFIQEMVKHQKPYDLAIYPGERHGIRNPESVIHYQTKLINYFNKNL